MCNILQYPHPHVVICICDQVLSREYKTQRQMKAKVSTF